MTPLTFKQQVHRVVQAIPSGKVATYGQVAMLAGNPRGAQQVGYILAALQELIPPYNIVPWQRVINRHGEISYSTSRGGGDDLQRHLLEAEGIVFSPTGVIDLARYRWEAGLELA